MVEHQGPRRRAVVEIWVNGAPITTRLHPYLISVQVVDNLDSYDKCSIELDDRNAELQLPPDKVPIQVAMGWAGEGPDLPDRGRTSIDSVTGKTIGQGALKKTEVEKRLEQPWGGPGMVVIFTGTVMEVESGFGRRGGGRRVWIEATSGDQSGPIKEVQQGSEGAGKPEDGAQVPVSAQIPLKQMMTKVFGPLGMTVKLSPQMAKVTRDFWHINASPAAWASDIAASVGGVLKIANKVAVIVGKNEKVNADGEATPTIDAIWGINLIGWRIRPYTNRAQWGGAAARFFDLQNAAWQVAQKAIGGKTPFGGATAISNLVHSVVDKEVATQNNDGGDKDSLARRGTGWVLINGEPNAKAGANVRIQHARPGVDGEYYITIAEHMYTRGVGYTTRLEVANPIPDSDDYKGWPKQKEEEEPPKEKPPVEGPERVPQQSTWTPEELEGLRREYIARGEPLPESLRQATDPNAPGYVSAEYLEMARQYYEGTAEQQAAARAYFANLSDQLQLTPGQRRSRQLQMQP